MSTTTAPEDLKRTVRVRRYRSPVNRAHLDQATFGERLADNIASGIGSWTFLIVQSIAVICWITANLWLLTRHPFDPYPFVLLNLMFSVQAAYTGPVLLLAGNRQSQKDRLTLEHAALEAEHADSKDRSILTEIKHNTELTVKILERLEKLDVAAG
jgi:uncharacterized membrane protein